MCHNFASNRSWTLKFFVGIWGVGSHPYICVCACMHMCMCIVHTHVQYTPKQEIADKGNGDKEI